jgi:hypothetical protein
VLQEVLALFQIKPIDEDNNQPPSPQAELHPMAPDTHIKDPGSLTFQLVCEIQNQPVRLLIDSGSTHSFLNSKLAPLRKGVVPLKTALRVKVADGAHMQSQLGIQNCTYYYDQHEFHTHFKFLALGTYDGIVGLD